MNTQLLYQWTEQLASHFPSLNQWQVRQVALFSYGVIQAESCQQEQVARQVSQTTQVESSARRWRRFLHNRQWAVSAWSVEWTQWVVSGLQTPQITLLVDETKLSDRLGVMMVGIAWEGRCLPLAWRAYRLTAYPREGQVGMITRLLKQVQAGLPASMAVLVLADRGIGCSPDLCKAVAALGWHYLFRVTCQTKIVTEQGDYTIAQQVQPGELWAASGQVFKQRGKLTGRALARWSVGYDEPWALVTNAPEVTGAEYAQRMWQEASFRDLKSGGWQWGASRVRQPDHVERLLVVLVVAYVWVIALGSQRVAQHCAHPLHATKAGGWRRHWSLFKDGLDYFVEYVHRYAVCLGLLFIPDTRLT